MPQCAAFGCYNQQKKASEKKFFQLPGKIRDAKRRKLWIKKINRRNWIPTDNVRLCEDHFSEKNFEQHRKDGVQKLKPNAVPDIFIHKPQPKPRKPPAVRHGPTLTNSLTKETEGILSSEPQDDSVLDLSYPGNCASSNSEPSGSNVQNEVLHEECKRKLNLAQKTALKYKEMNSTLTANLNQLFGEDEMKFLKMGSMRGFKWSEASSQKALRIFLSCGKTGYETLRGMGYPLPCVRVLYSKLEGLKFQPGILMEVIEAMAVKVEAMQPQEKVAVLMIDEMSIQPGFEYDSSTGLILGKPTIPGAVLEKQEPVATHALVFMLAGISTRWKQTVAYHFTGKSFHADLVKDMIFHVIQICETIGLEIHVLTMDMGGQNQGILRQCGIVAGRYCRTINHCQHPCDKDRKLYFMLDPPHILKNLRNHLTEGQAITIPDDVCQKYNLPCQVVKIDHLKKLALFNQLHDIQLSPKLRESVLQPHHFEKMKVGLALALFSHDNGAAIEYLVENGQMDNDARTTAWFLKRIHRWFYLISSRTNVAALSHHREDTFNESIEFLEEMRDLFQRIRIGPGGVWKPVQTAMTLTITTVLNLQAVILEEKHFQYLLLSRLSQDALENLFCTVRMKNPIPTVRQFKQNLRTITVAQFFKPPKHGSYLPDDSEFLVEFMKKSTPSGMAEPEAKNRSQSKENNWDEICGDEKVEDDCLMKESDIESISETAEKTCDSDLTTNESAALYKLCGRTVFCVKKKYKLKCCICNDAMYATPSDLHKKCHGTLTELCSYVSRKPGMTSLVSVSDAVFDLLKRVEMTVKVNESKLVNSEMTLEELEKQAHLINTVLPKCHNIGPKLIRIYATARMYFLARKYNSTLKFEKSIKCGSRSMGMSNAVMYRK